MIKKYLELLFLELGKLNIDFEIVVFETVFLTTKITEKFGGYDMIIDSLARPSPKTKQLTEKVCFDSC